MAVASELSINAGASAWQMAQTIFGEGVQVTSARYSGSWYSSGMFTGGDTTTPGVTPSDSGVILSTGAVQYFTNASGDPNVRANTSYNSGGQNYEADFQSISSVNTFDAAFLEMDFIPTGDVMTIKFVFSSDEYPEYSTSIYNDVVGVWSNGTHIPLSVTQSAASVVEINDAENINLYKDNTGDRFNTEMDGLTVTMTLTIPVNAGQVNTLKIGIADAADSSYDSNLLIAANSLQTMVVAQQDDLEMEVGGTRNLDALANDLNKTGGALEITQINGVDVSVGDTVILPSGHMVQLMPDGTLDITATDDEGTVNFTYTVTSYAPNGQELLDDVGFVSVDVVPCFVAGTLIRTPGGEVPVERLAVGDLVETLDHGPRPLRWVGSRTVEAQGDFAPIAFARDALGHHEALLLSPQHRVLLTDAMAALLFGEAEVLVAARHLVNDLTIRPREGGTVTYLHLMFDRHEVIWSNGLPTESFLPGPQMTRAFEADTLREISTLFPDIDWISGAGYGPAARRTLRRYEARVMAGARA